MTRRIVTAREQHAMLSPWQQDARLAMAWDQWAPQIKGGCDNGCDHDRMMMGEYSIDHPNGSGPQPGDLLPGIKGRSLLQFTHDTDEHGNPEMYVSGIHVDEGHRRDGIAEALMRRMHQDHPDTPINPGFMTDMGEGLLDGLKKRIPDAGDALVPRHAAVTQNLVDRLHDEFHQWWPTSRGPEVQSNAEYGDPDVGPISHWPAIEGFLRDRYPAAHKGHEMGFEEARHILDGHDPMPYQQNGGADVTPYATGPDAIAQHGYDPAEITAGMILLHNQAHPLRADMAQEDQRRLNDIFDKRVKMQRNYEQRQTTAAARHTASWFHPEIGIEEYPALTGKERKALYSEIKAQGGPEVLSNVYHPENWGSGDPTGEHHYIARGQDGTIHGVLAATRSYKKMEPKRPGSYSSMNVHDIYTGADAPKGTGTALMQAAAHRAMRDGASFGVSGAVHSARPFYHNLGGTTNEINLSSGFNWEPEDRDALATGKPNRKPVTPMPLDVWNPDLKRYEKHYKMPPGADEPPEFGDIFVDNSLRQRQTTAVARLAMPAVDAYDNPVPTYRRRDTQTIRSGPWYHATDAELQPGEFLTPRGGPSQWGPDAGDFYNNGRENRPDWVWMAESPHRARAWGNHVYEVEPQDEGPWAWNMSPLHDKPAGFNDGYVSPRAKIVRKLGPEDFRTSWDDDYKPSARDAVTAAANPDRLMGVNVNDTHQDYTGQILRGEKTIETRDTRSLNPYVGRRIALFRTHDSKRVPTLVVGHATVGEPVHYPDAESFDADYDRHLVGPDSPHHFARAKYGEKYGYPMIDPVALDRPMLVNSTGNVARGAEDTDFAPYDGPWPL